MNETQPRHRYNTTPAAVLQSATVRRQSREHSHNAGKRPRFPRPTSSAKWSMTSARLAGWSNPTQPNPLRPGPAQTPWSIQRLVSSTARTCCCSAAEPPVTSALRQTVCLSPYSIAADISSSSSGSGGGGSRVSRQRRRAAADTNLRPRARPTCIHTKSNWRRRRRTKTLRWIFTCIQQTQQEATLSRNKTTSSRSTAAACSSASVASAQIQRNEHVYSPRRQKHTHQINNKQYTNIPKKEKKDNQSICNLACSTKPGIMLENFTLQDTNVVCSIVAYINMFSLSVRPFKHVLWFRRCAFAIKRDVY